ncbi:MAG: DUF4355 domain-containing protein [Bacteroides sp.]|nr:DUF4355 domain-containing protein [Bacteroides sp.]
MESNKEGSKFNMELNELNLTEEQKADVQKLLQSHEDRIRTDYSKKLKDAETELAKYKPVEKSESEKKLEERISALEAKEKELADKEKAMTIASKLKEKGIPTELAQYLNVGDNIDETLENVGTALGNYFLDNTNKPSNHNTNRGVTKNDFRKMSYSERAKLFQENPQLYNTLSK